MLCRAILTAIAISCMFSREIPVHANGQGSPRIVQIKDVICVLLLSGLQKEELDANTMEKLRRHNVNIYDMNNESLRQECLLKSLNIGKENADLVITEDKNDTLTIPINKQIQSEGLNAEIQKSEITAAENYFVDKTNLQSLIDEIKVKGMVQREQNRNDNAELGKAMEIAQDEINVTVVDGNKETRIEYSQSQPSLDTVMQFWSKFTRKNNAEDVIKITTAHIEENTRSTVSSDNTGYVHSREMEYINRMIAEYLASQTVPTTTQVIKRKKNIDVIPRKIKELLAKRAKDDEIDPIAALKNMGKAFSLRTLSDLTEIIGPIRINNKDGGATRKALRMTSADINYDNNEPPRRLESMPNDPLANVSPRTVVKKTVPKMEALKYLDAILRLNKETKMNTEPNSTSEKTTQESIINFGELESSMKSYTDVQYKAEDVNDTKKNISQAQSNGVASDQVPLPADVIQKIAETVKEIVLKDIRMSATEATAVTTTNPTTSSTTATSKKEVPALYLKDTKNDNQMIQTLMQLFKEYKPVKETTKAPVKMILKSNTGNFRNPTLDHMLPPIMAGANPYEIKLQVPNIKDMRLNPYKQSLVQIPLSPADRALQAIPYNRQPKIYQKNEYRMPPITIQTNSVEVPPLSVPLSKPIPLINQHIIVTSPNSFEIYKMEHLQQENKQKMNNKYKEVLGVGNERIHHIENPTYADLAKKVYIDKNIKDEFGDTYKDRIQKLKERIKYAHDHNRAKARELNRALGLDHHLGASRLVEPSYQGGLSSNIGSNHHEPLNQLTKHHDVFNRPLDSNLRDTFERPLERKHHESLNRPLDVNHHETVSRPLTSDVHENLNRPMDPTFHEALSRPLESNHHQNFNRPMESSHHESANRPGDQYATINRPEEPSKRDIITREVLSRLVGSNHHDVISRLVEPNPHDVINIPVDVNQQSRSHHSDAYERIEHERTQPRYKGTRFHEELERIETLPRNNYVNNKMRPNCCDDVAARQQMPLAKIRTHGRFDDTHFRNFLKSQQKVTDMLERILASKTKQEGPQTVEIS